MTAAIVITGAPGSGKSSVARAFTTLLGNAGVEHGAIESEQLAWGTPWLPDVLVREPLAGPPNLRERWKLQAQAEDSTARVRGGRCGRLPRFPTRPPST